jgi:hypothetical protein
MEMNGQLHTPTTLPPSRKIPWYPLDRGLGGPKSWYGCGGQEKNFQPLPGLKPLIIQPTAQQYTTELSQLLIRGACRTTLLTYIKCCTDKLPGSVNCAQHPAMVYNSWFGLMKDDTL